MANWNQSHTDLLIQHARPVSHMWRQIREGRFGLVFGAGLSSDFGVPTWGSLLDRIARDRAVQGEDVVASQKKAPASSLAQVLFQHFAARMVGKEDGDPGKEAIKRAWRDVIRRQLYKDAKKKVPTYLSSHYIREYLPIIKRSPMTVTYNFDDFLEQFLEWERQNDSAGPAKARPYETIWRPDIQTRRSHGVIYHPNGFLPRLEAEPASDALVFSEDEFADQLMESISGRYASLLHFLSKHTCLLVGLSLNDATLKHLLRQNAQLNPGHFHYYVAFEDDGVPTPDCVRKAIFEANFEVHNLITLFMTRSELSALGFILNCDDAHDLLGRAKDAGTTLRYYYYVTGVPGAGKSTSIACLRSYTTYDEWLDARQPGMSQRTQMLSADRTEAIDAWVASQFDQKNRLLEESPEKEIGIHVLDRCILDPMSFKRPNERPKRARTLLDAVCGKARDGDIKGGMVFLLKGDPELLEYRCRAGGKQFTRKDLSRMQATLEKAYAGEHLCVINTRHKSRSDVVREMVRGMYMPGYRPADLKRRLENIEARRVKW